MLGRADGTKVHFLFPNTLHIVGNIFWMLPCVTKTDMNDACKRANVSHVSRNNFLQMLLDEHKAPGSRDQLKELWTEGLDKYYVSETVGDASGEIAGRAADPHVSGGEEEVDPTAAAEAGPAGAPAEPSLRSC